MVSRIRTMAQFTDLWEKTCNTKGGSDCDCIQEIHGMKEFRAMTEGLTSRSQDLNMKMTNIMMEGKLLFLDWEMTLTFRQTRSSTIYGLSRLTLNEEGKIAEQSNCYDLWGDVFDNIPGVEKGYRTFMKKLFG